MIDITIIGSIDEPNFIIGRNKSNDFTIGYTPIITVEGEPTGSLTVNDINFDIASESITTTYGSVSVVSSADIYPYKITYESESPSIATINENGLITNVIGNGNCEVLASVQFVGEKITNIPCSISTVGGGKIFSSWVSGSLSEAAAQTTNSAINGIIQPTTNPNNYNGNVIQQYPYTVNNGVNVFERNTENLLNNYVDLTCMAAPVNYLPGNLGIADENGGFVAIPTDIGTRGLTAVTNQHVISASHFSRPGPTTPIYFIGNDNTQYERFIVAGTQVGLTDIWIGILNDPLPVAIKPASILPANYASYLPSLSYSYNLPIFYCFHFDNDIHIGGWYAYDQPLGSDTQDIYFSTVNPITECPGAINFSQLSSGSGSPYFIIVNGVYSLIGTLHYKTGNAYGGPNVSDNIDAVNASMATLTTLYNARSSRTDSIQTLDEISLAGFLSF